MKHTIPRTFFVKKFMTVGKDNFLGTERYLYIFLSVGPGALTSSV